MDDAQLHRSYVLSLLERRDYSRATLVRKLRALELDAASAGSLLDALAELGLFREQAYAMARTRQLLRRDLAVSLVKDSLCSQKCEVSDADVAQAFEDIGSTPQEEILALVEKALRK